MVSSLKDDSCFAHTARRNTYSACGLLDEPGVEKRMEICINSYR